MSVSVVIPVKNGAAYLREALQSAVAQGPDVAEIIVVDDGSIDGSLQIAAEFCDRVTVHRNPGAGVSAARNEGARSASGEWLLFLDADDRLKPGAVETLMIAAARANNALVVYGDFDRIDANGSRIGIRHLAHRRRKPSGLVLNRLVEGFFLGNGGTSIVRANAFAQVGGFDTRLRYCEDWHLWCKLAALGEFAYVRGARVLDYRIHPTNTTDGRFRSYDDCLPALETVFSDRLISQRLHSGDITSLRSLAEVHLMTYSASLAFRSGNFWRAAQQAFMAVLQSPRRAPGILARVTLARIWI
jgi:glycosyltransferase involved in cell wall biosynthesis